MFEPLPQGPGRDAAAVAAQFQMCMGVDEARQQNALAQVLDGPGSRRAIPAHADDAAAIDVDRSPFDRLARYG